MAPRISQVRDQSGTVQNRKFIEESDLPNTIATVGDADYQIAATDWIVVTSAALTTTRTWTLPAASAVKPYHSILVFDRAGGVTLANNISVARGGADTIDTVLTSFAINGAFLGALFISDGVSKWTAYWAFANTAGLLDNVGSTRGSIMYRGASGWTILTPGTSAYVLTSNGSGADPSYQALPANTSAILQCLQNTYTTNADLTVSLPIDDTVPTSTEGTQVLSQAITPADNTNKVLCQIALQAAGSGQVGVSLLRGTTTVWAAVFAPAASGETLTGVFLDSPASASAQTYSVRAGTNAGGAGVLRLNGSLSGRFFGGVSAATLTLMEVNA